MHVSVTFYLYNDPVLVFFIFKISCNIFTYQISKSPKNSFVTTYIVFHLLSKFKISIKQLLSVLNYTHTNKMDAEMTMSLASSLQMAAGSSNLYQIPSDCFSSRSPSSISQPQFQVPLLLHRQNSLTLEKERKSDRVMKGVTGLNFRPGVEIENGDKNLTSAPSVRTSSISDPTRLTLNSNCLYGFYWTCCNKIVEKAKVLGSLKGAMETAVKSPVSYIFFLFLCGYVWCEAANFC